MEAVSNFMWPTEICQASLMTLLANVSQHSLCPCVFEKSLQHLTCVWIQKVKWRLHFFHAHLFICFLSPLFFLSHLFCISLLIRTVGGPSSHVPPHPRRLQYSSHSADYMIENYSGVDFWKSGTVFFCFFFSSVRCMEKLRNLSISGHSQHLLRRKRRSARREGTEREREEKDVTMQSAPSAQRLRCGLAPSSQSQPDPHIAFIYLWKRGERRACDGEWEQETETGSGWQGRRGGWWCWWVDVCVWGGVKKKGKSKSFVFTHTESLPETLDHISDSLLSSLLTQSHVKDWWARWWTKINQSHSHSHRQTAREAGEQPGRPSSVSKTRPRFSLAKSRSLFFLFFLFFPQWSFSSSLLPSFVSVMAALDCCFNRSIQRLAEKKLGGQTDDPRTV